jgi:hypothetical protein
MAVRIPLITDFDGRGIDKAKREFAQLEGAGKKSAFLLKKAFIPATAAIGGLAAITFDAVKSAIEDEKAQAQLERTIRATTKATDKQIQALNDYITNAGKSFGITDDDLRPAMQRLATATTDVEDSMRLATLAMDISTATGKPLEAVADALGKAFNGQYLALNKLDPSLRDVVKSGGDADEVFGRLNDKFGGAAQANAETAAGKFQIFKVRMDELKESIGASLLPVLDEMLPYLDKFATWAEENPGTFKAVAAAIAAVAASIVAVNLAMAVNPIALLAGGIAALMAISIIAGPQISAFMDNLKKEIEDVLGPFGTLLAHFFTLGKLASGEVGGGGGIGGVLSRMLGTAKTVIPGLGALTGLIGNIPGLAEGGIVTGPTLALIGEAGPEAVVPLDRGGAMGNITINVNGGDPNAVVDALRRYMVTNGPVPITVA